MKIKKTVQNILKTSKKVFSKPSSWGLMLLISAGYLVLAIWLPHIDFIWDIIVSDTYPIFRKAKILFYSLGGFRTTLTLQDQIFSVITALLVGLNITFVVYYFKNKFVFVKEAGGGLLGTFAALLGTGCSACGSVVLSSFFGVSATATTLDLFPLGGAEISILGALIILITIGIVANKIEQPVVCSVKK